MARCFAVMMMLLLVAVAAAAQSATPQLSRPQRDVLRRMVAAVETASGGPETIGATWQIHLLRASDGSHYVAFSVEPPVTSAVPVGPVLLYVRLASAALTGRGVERSAVADWLEGRRSDPLLRPRIGIAIGDMPAFGAAGLFDPNRPGRPAPVPSGSNDLKLLQLEREREREKKEERDRQRRAELEGSAQTKRELLPFEDFDIATPNDARTGAFQRALTAGPGDYELSVAWTGSSGGPSSPIQILKRTLRLPPAGASELAVSSIIVADQANTRTTPYPSLQQASHPYAIGLTDLTPARDTIFSRDERLTVAFQVINPRATETGKPDLGISFRIVRLNGDKEQPVAALTPQEYTAETLPDNFDLRLGHPIFAAMSVPLETLNRGAYRLKIAVNDRVSGRGTAADAEFTVAGTPALLLAEAPSVAASFRREMALEPAVIDDIATRLRPASPSAALSRALDSLRQRRFPDLMHEEPVEASERRIRVVLTAIAVYALGDPSSAVQFQRSMQMNAESAPARFFLGAARAAEGRDADAIVAWQGALDAGIPPAIVLPLLVNAHFRQGEFSRAAELIEAGPPGGLLRERAALDIASGRERHAIAPLERRVADEPSDLDAEWLLVHALYAGLVRQPDAALSEKFVRLARAYVANQRAHAALVGEWLRVVLPN